MALNYYVVYKPFEVLSRFTPEGDKLCLANYFKVPPDVYPVGRLDYDSEGLLILTNDKSLNRKLLLPQYAHEREYWVQVDGAISTNALKQLQTGVQINVDGKIYRTLPCIAELIQEEPVLPPRNPPIRFRKNIPAPWVRMVLQEGKNRQVRRMTAAVGFPTLRLVRYRIEDISIAGLKPGEMRPLGKKQLYQCLRMKA